MCGSLLAERIFQSALPLRGATRRGGVSMASNEISIRAPLAGSDQKLIEIVSRHIKISIRAPLAGSDFSALKSTL